MGMYEVLVFETTPELIMKSYEFMPNEFVNALEVVTLETQSTESGTKDFVIVGTTIGRGEDLAAKGAVSGAHTFA